MHGFVESQEIWLPLVAQHGELTPPLDVERFDSEAASASQAGTLVRGFRVKTEARGCRAAWDNCDDKTISTCIRTCPFLETKGSQRFHGIGEAELESSPDVYFLGRACLRQGGSGTAICFAQRATSQTLWQWSARPGCLLDCHWVGSLDSDFLGNARCFPLNPPKRQLFAAVNSNQVYGPVFA